jgi:toxin ParE1/3/4
MSRAILKRPRAEEDLIRCYGHLAAQASIETAERFMEAAESTLRLLAKTPGIGAPYETTNPSLAALRSFPISKFKRYILLYQVFRDRIELVRVLHGARDITMILNLEGNGAG